MQAADVVGCAEATVFAQYPPTPVRLSAAGGNHALAATSTVGRLLATGDNEFGQLGIGESGGAFNTPVAVHYPPIPRAARVTSQQWLSRNPDCTIHIRLAVERRGALVGLVRALTGSRIRRFIDMEAAGLKATSEAYESKAG